MVNHKLLQEREYAITDSFLLAFAYSRRYTNETILFNSTKKSPISQFPIRIQ